LGSAALARDKKNACRQHAWIFFQDESGFSQQPSVRTTWAPCGQTPILKECGNHWDKTSVSGALGFRWDGEQARLFARTRRGSFNTESLMTFLKQLRRFVQQQPVILIWDRLPAHRSRTMADFITSQRHWLQLEWLPAYAPDLNPIEGVWNNIKSREMANYCPDLLSAAAKRFRSGLNRVSHTRRLPFSLLRHAGLSF
jgi:transposase